MIVDFFGNEINVNDVVVVGDRNGWNPTFTYWRVIKVNPKMLRIRRLGVKSRKPREDTVYGETVILASEEQMIMHVLRHKEKPKERA